MLTAVRHSAITDHGSLGARRVLSGAVPVSSDAYVCSLLVMHSGVLGLSLFSFSGFCQTFSGFPR